MKTVLFIADSSDESEKKIVFSLGAEALGVKRVFRQFVALHEMMIPPAQIRGMIAGADAIVFDYGGMSMPWASGPANIDHWNRWFMEVITDFPSKVWICTSAIQTFEDEDKQRLKEMGVIFKYRN